MNPGSVNYATIGAANAGTYVWELLPADAGALYPSGTSLSIAWSATFTGAATLKVKGVNGSCEGTWSSPLNITVVPGPNAFAITGGGVYCAIGGAGIPVGLSGSQSGTNYTLYRDNVATTNVVAGSGSAISFGNQMSAGNYTVMASTTAGNCTNTMTGAAAISVDPQAPLSPGAPSGPAQVYTGAMPTTDYLTTGGTYATTYAWEIAPADAGTITGNSITGTATWNPSFAGPASIKVQGVNSCGSGTYSTEFVVTVDVGVGLSEPKQARLFSLYPNPARSSVTIIPVKNMDATISIMNTLGSQMMELKDVQFTGPYSIDISKLTTGVYFVRINSDQGRQIVKLVVE
jgi:hypothetical protein